MSAEEQIKKLEQRLAAIEKSQTREGKKASPPSGESNSQAEARLAELERWRSAAIHAELSGFSAHLKQDVGEYRAHLEKLSANAEKTSARVILFGGGGILVIFFGIWTFVENQSKNLTAQFQNNNEIVATMRADLEKKIEAQVSQEALQNSVSNRIKDKIEREIMEHTQESTLAAITQGLAMLRLHIEDQLSHPELHRKRSVPYEQAWEIRQALRDLNEEYSERIAQRRIEPHHRDAVFHLIYGITELTTGNTAAAFQRFQVAATIDKENFDARRLMLLAHNVKPMCNSTVVFEETKKIAGAMWPRTARAAYFHEAARVSLEMKVNHYPEAEQMCDTALLMVDVPAYRNMLKYKKATCQSHQRKQKEAVETYMEILAEEPDHTEIANAIIWELSHPVANEDVTDPRQIKLYEGELKLPLPASTDEAKTIREPAAVAALVQRHLSEFSQAPSVRYLANWADTAMQGYYAIRNFGPGNENKKNAIKWALLTKEADLYQNYAPGALTKLADLVLKDIGPQP